MLVLTFTGILFLIGALVCIHLVLKNETEYIGYLIVFALIFLVFSAGAFYSLQTYSGGRPMDYKDLEVGAYRLFSTYQGPSDDGYITVLIQKDGEKTVRSVVFKKEDWRVEKNDGYITVEEQTINNGAERKEKIAY
jgi:hypothetical protein